MALRNIVKIGEPGESALNSSTREVKRFDDRLKTLAEDMIETMHAEGGIGLAGPQVGILKRIFVMNVIPEEGDIIVINPEIVEKDGESVAYEGCLSLPQMYGQVKRSTNLKLKYQDLNGEFHEMEAEGLKARCIQHEYDHLDGIMFTEKLIGPLVHESQLSQEEDNNNDDNNQTEKKDDLIAEEE